MSIFRSRVNKVAIETGTYTGDGSTDKTITLSNASLTPKFIMIWCVGAGSEDPAWWFSDMAAGKCCQIRDGGTIVQEDSAIISQAKGNFHVDDRGSDSDPNKNTIVYAYIVIGEQY